MGLFRRTKNTNKTLIPRSRRSATGGSERINNDDSSLKAYTYGYDALNRITEGIFDVNTYSLTGIAYDKNGNITSLQRNKYSGNDSFGYTYSGNQLTSLSGTDPGNFSYDDNGNMITDSRKDITNIDYNYLNLPTGIAIDGGNIQYIYDGTGAKQRKVAAGTTTDYAGNYIYKNGNLEFFSHPEGYVEYDNGNFNYVFQYKDHLGNIRLSYTDANNNGTIESGSSYSEIIKENNYYPFGLTHQGYNDDISSLGSDAAKKYMFGGKELQDEQSILV